MIDGEPCAAPALPRLPYCHAHQVLVETAGREVFTFVEALGRMIFGRGTDRPRSVPRPLPPRIRIKNYYKILGVPQTATPDEIKAAYRVKIMTAHPDRAPRDKQAEYHERTVRINEAYRILSDPAKRVQYDTVLGRIR